MQPSAWIWVHAQNAEHASDLMSAASRGAWIELDAIREDTFEKHLAYLQALIDEGHSARVLLSHDGNSMRLTGKPARQYERLYTDFIPLLRRSGLGASVDDWTIRNPARAFTLSKRKIEK